MSGNFKRLELCFSNYLHEFIWSKYAHTQKIVNFQKEETKNNQNHEPQRFDYGIPVHGIHLK